MRDEQATEPESVGKQIGRYRLAYEIAAGGQASIFMAVADGPSGFGKVVALKRLHKHLAKEPAFVSMFLDEARLASQLTHPNICGVIDFGVEDGEHFMAMEYLTGVTVAKLASQAQKLASQGKLDRERWVRLVAFVIASAADGLRAAHELLGSRGEKLNVVHRDVSPQNVMVGFDGSVRVMDFGIAKYDERETETSMGEVKGKYAYMSPEQARGETLDRRTDIWALGVIAWELLTLRRLFKRETTAQTAVAVLHEPIDAPSTLEPLAEGEIDRLVLAALTRDIDHRIGDARAFGSALRKAAGGDFDASDLATFVQTTFPAAEAEARTMVDLARQSARGLPSIAKRDGETSNSSMSVPLHVVEPSLVERPASKRGAVYAGAAIIAVLAIGAAILGVQLAAGEPPQTTELAVAHPNDPPSDPPSVDPPSVDPPSIDPPSVDPPPLPVTAPPPLEPEAREPDAIDTTPPATTLARQPAIDAVGTGTRPRVRVSAEPEPDPPATSPVAPPSSSTPPTTAAPASDTGLLVVVTPGTWANVYGPNDELWGATPLRRQLHEGPYQMELRFEGQPPGRDVTATVRGGETTRVIERP